MRKGFCVLNIKLLLETYTELYKIVKKSSKIDIKKWYNNYLYRKHNLLNENKLLPFFEKLNAMK